MINNISVVLMGVVEGLTEFLPISSTFHLILTSRILGLDESEYLKMFQVVIQSGAILAVLALFWKKFLDKEMLLSLLYSFVPTAIVGLILHKVIKDVFFEAYALQLVVFVAVGVVFLFVKSRNTEDKTLTRKQAILIGLIQAMAVIPGVSRAGAVIVGMSLLGFNKKQSAQYSFLIAVPTILAAGVLDLYQGRELLNTPGAGWQMLVGSLISFLVAIGCIKWFMGFNERNGLKVWGIYRVVLGVALIVGKLIV